MKVKLVQFLMSSIQGSDFVQSFITVHCLIIVKTTEMFYETKHNETDLYVYFTNKNRHIKWTRKDCILK